MKQYAIFNPKEGLYTMANTVEETLDIVAEIAFNFYLEHSHNNPISVVTKNDDGNEEWRNLAGNEVLIIDSLIRESMIVKVNTVIDKNNL